VVFAVSMYVSAYVENLSVTNVNYCFASSKSP
jgi:hypothetical protein